MAPASWLLDLHLQLGLPSFGRMVEGRFVPALAGRHVREAWLHIPVLFGAGIDLFRVEPRRFAAIVHWAAPRAEREALPDALGDAVVRAIPAPGGCWRGPVWRPAHRWQPLPRFADVAAARRRLQAGPGAAVRLRCTG